MHSSRSHCLLDNLKQWSLSLRQWSISPEGRSQCKSREAEIRAEAHHTVSWLLCKPQHRSHCCQHSKQDPPACNPQFNAKCGKSKPTGSIEKGITNDQCHNIRSFGRSIEIYISHRYIHFKIKDSKTEILVVVTDVLQLGVTKDATPTSTRCSFVDKGPTATRWTSNQQSMWNQFEHTANYAA